MIRCQTCKPTRAPRAPNGYIRQATLPYDRTFNNYSQRFEVVFICLFYLGFNVTFNTLYRSYHDGQFYGQRKPVHTVGQGSVL